jgi:ABC-2 type transport system ATP-binding protein
VVVAGRLVALGTPAELAAQGRSTVVEFRLGATDAAAAVDGAPPGLTAALGAGSRLEPDGTGWRVATDDATATLHSLTTWSLERHVELDALEVRRPTLEDAYLELVGERAVHAGADEAVTA